jgi:4-diphosphocytidyl-2-C-methyl-D-erythritol kinase
MPAPLTEIAYAKLNLALHVRRRREDGYHELETLFAFADQGDILHAEAADGLSMEIIGPFAQELKADDHNLVVRAAMALSQATDVRKGARIVLEKNLPIASGIGGGSADAAAALRLLTRLWKVEADLMAIAVSLGADVPACVASQTVFGSGIGDELRSVPDEGITGTPLLLVNPGVACPTGPIFKAWDGFDRGALDSALWREGRNDLEEPAIRLIPEIGGVLAALRRQAGCGLVRMSGSGATCFALFETSAQRDAACAMLNVEQPHWWTMAAALR